MITRAKVKLGKGDDHEVFFNHDVNLPEPLIRRALAHSIMGVEEQSDPKYQSRADKEKLVGLVLGYLLAHRTAWYTAGKDKASEEPIVAGLLADLFA